MAAPEAVHAEPDAGAVYRLPVCRQADGRRGSACAGHGKDALVLGIQVNHGSSLQSGQVDGVRTQHSDFLVHRDDDFQGRMWNGVVRQQRQGVGHRNAVVTAKGRTPGKDIFVVVAQLQALYLHIDGAVRVLFAHHIHVSLQNHGGVILHAAGARAEQNHIILLILLIPKAVLLRKGHQVVGNLLGIPGAVGNGADRFKIIKDRGRLQTCQLFGFHITYSFSLYDLISQSAVGGLVNPSSASLFYHSHMEKSIANSHRKSQRLRPFP